MKLWKGKDKRAKKGSLQIIQKYELKHILLMQNSENYIALSTSK